MEITLEQVEKIREKTGLSYGEAKAALERNGGDLLETLIDLERRGQSDTAGQGGFYSTQGQAGASVDALVLTSGAGRESAGGKKCGGDRWGEVWNAFCEVWNAFCDLLRRTLSNQFEVWRGDRIMTTMPVLVLVVLVVFFFWITLPLAAVGLFFGFRYRFHGPDLGRENVNRVMDQVSATVDDMKENVKREFHSGKHTK